MTLKQFQLSTFLTSFVLFVATTAFAQYYWVGGSGNWSDYANHWATASGGNMFHTQAPTESDDVYFDMNSFTSGGQTVTMDVNNSACHSMDWTGVLNNPSFNSSNYEVIHVHGDLTFSPDMLCNISVLQLSSSEMGNTVTSNGTSLGASAILRINGTGEWTLQDTFECDQVQFSQGTFHTDGNTMNIGFSFTLNGSLSKTVDLGTSTMNMQQWRTWGDNNNIMLTDYTINTMTFYADEDDTGPYTYNDIIFDTNGAIFEGGGNFNFVDITGTAGEFMRFESGKTFVINELVGTGTRHDPLKLEVTTPGDEAFVQQASGNVTLEYLLLQDIHVSGGATFTADQAVDQGNNMGWNIIPIEALEYYWIGNGGDWEDMSHWSNMSGGSPFYTELPSRFDDVYIDVSSVTMPGQTILVNEAQDMRNLDCTGVEFDPTLDAGYQKPLNVYGYLDFTEGLDRAIHSVNFQGEEVYDIYLGTQGSASYINFWGGGTYTLQNSIECATFLLADGTVDLNDNDVTCAFDFKESNSNSSIFYFGSGTITCRDFTMQSDNITVNAETSTIVCERDFKGYGHDYYRLLLVDEGSIFYDNSFEILEFAPGVISQLEAGTTQTIGQDLIVNGTPEAPINIGSTEAGVESTLSLASGTVDGIYLILQDNNATGGATFNATQSIDNGNNTGWNITEIVPQDFYWVGGTGDWSDAANHWAGTSGGTDFYGFVPGVLDNVYFDENSFTDVGQILTIDLETVNVHDMDWTGVLYTPYVNGNQKTVNVYGSLVFASSMSVDVTNFNFFSNENEIIDPGYEGSPGNNTFFYFNSAGSWDLQNNLTVRELDLEGGTFTTNNYDVWVDFGTNFFGTNAKVLNLGTSEMYSRGFGWEGLGGDNLIINGGSSSLTISGSFSADPQTPTENLEYTFNDLHFSADLPDQGGIFSDVTLNTLSIDPGKSVDIWNATIVTVNQLICAGTSDDFISIQGTTEGTQGVISQASGEVAGQFLNLKDISGTGGATFLASSSNDLGNVSGWIFDGQAQSITFDPIDDVLEDIGTFALSATASSGLDVEYEIISGPATVDGNMITVTGAGPVEVQASQPGNFEYNSAPSVAVEFCSNPLQPVVTGTLVGDYVLLTSSSLANNQWYFNGNLIVDAINQEYEAFENGIYTVQVTVDGCASALSDEFEVIDLSIGQALSQVNNLYPNPAGQYFNLDVNATEPLTLEVTTSQGNLVATERIPFGVSTHVISVEDWSHGIYLVRIRGTKFLWQDLLLKH